MIHLTIFGVDHNEEKIVVIIYVLLLNSKTLMFYYQMVAYSANKNVPIDE